MQDDWQRCRHRMNKTIVRASIWNIVRVIASNGTVEIDGAVNCGLKSDLTMLDTHNVTLQLCGITYCRRGFSVRSVKVRHCIYAIIGSFLCIIGSFLCIIGVVSSY